MLKMSHKQCGRESHSDIPVQVLETVTQQVGQFLAGMGSKYLQKAQREGPSIVFVLWEQTRLMGLCEECKPGDMQTLSDVGTAGHQRWAFVPPLLWVKMTLQTTSSLFEVLQGATWWDLTRGSCGSYWWTPGGREALEAPQKEVD